MSLDLAQTIRSLRDLAPPDVACPRCGALVSGLAVAELGMCDDCYARREATRARLEASGIVRERWHDNLAGLTRNEDNKAALAQLEAWNYGPVGLYIHGPVGTGKTCAAQCLALREIVKGRRSALVANVPAMLATIRRSFGATGESTDIDQVAQCVRLLVLDDLGAEKLTDWALETMFLIVDRRVQRGLPMIITSNLSLRDLEKTAGPRIADRIAEACDVVFMGGQSFRVKKFIGRQS